MAKKKLHQTVISSEDLKTLGAIIDTAENMRNAYFRFPPTFPSSRRDLEISNTFDKIEWEEQGHKYSASYEVHCSRRNIYASGYYSRDGFRTTLTAIRNSYNRMVEEMESTTEDKNPVE